MNKLLTDFNNIVPYIILFVAFCIFILIIAILKKKEKVQHSKSKTNETNLSLKENYCSEQEMKFLEQLHKSLPKDFIAFPYVGVDNLVNPKGNKNDYNKLMAKYVDVCLFYRRTMQPILAIDLFNPNPITQALKKIDNDVYEALNKVGINIVQIKLIESYDLNILRKNIIDNLPNKILAMIKDKM